MRKGPAGGGEEFVLPNRDAVTEANWEQLRSQGVEPWINTDDVSELGAHTRLAAREVGIENVLTGAPFDWAEGRPLGHKPGVGVYTRPPRRSRNGTNGDSGHS